MKKMLLLIALLCPLWTYAQQEGDYRTIKGVVTDSVTGETLIGATVRIDTSSSVAKNLGPLGTVTDIDGKFAVQEGNLEWKETGSPIGIYHDCLNTYQWPDVYCYEGGYLAEIDSRYWYRCRQEGDRSVIDTLRVDSVGNNFYLLQGNTESLKVMQINAGIFTDNDTLIYNGQPGEWKPAGRVLVAYGKQKLTSQEKVLLQLFESLFSGDE